MFDGKDVFIKVDTKLHLLINDKISYDVGRELMGDSLVDILNYSLDGKIQFIAYEFLISSELDKSFLLDNMQYIDDILVILNNLSKLGIIHRDIKLDNFLVSNNRLKIIDFTFANSNINKDFKELDTRNSDNCFILEALGNGLNPTPFLWDDYYSLCTILKQITNNVGVDRRIKLVNYIKKIEKCIGKDEYTVKCNTRYYFFIRNIKIKIKYLLRIDHNHRIIVE